MDTLLSTIAIAISLSAAVFTGLTYRRSGRANLAENELLDVRWEVELARVDPQTASLKFTNVGTTVARSTHFAADRANDGKNSCFTFPDTFAKKVAPGASHVVRSHKALQPVEIDPANLLFEDPYLQWSVTWVSPLGNRETYKHYGNQVF